MKATFSALKRAVSFLCLAGIVSACTGNGGTPVPAPNYGKLNHIVVIYQENWSFDALYGQFPGANGVGPGASVA